MPDYIQQIKARIDIFDYIGRRQELKESGDYYFGKCPFHDDSGPSFSLYKKTGRFRCFGSGCGVNGDIIDYYCHENGLNPATDQRRAIEGLMLQELGIDINKDKWESGNEVTDEDYARRLITDYAHEAIWKNAEILKWLNDRGVDENDIRTWKIGCGTGTMIKDFEGRIHLGTLKSIGVWHQTKKGKVMDFIWNTMIMVPVHDEHGKISHWWLRDINEKACPQIKTDCRRGKKVSVEFFNVDDIVNSRQYNNTVFLVEGAWEVIQLKKRGHAAAAVMGQVSKRQVNYLKDLVRKDVVEFREDEYNMDDGRRTFNIWFDRDKKFQGQKASRELASEIYNYHHVSIWWCPELGQDPDSYLRGGGKVESVRHESVHERYMRIQLREGKYTISKKGNEYEITNFYVSPKYRLFNEDGTVSRQMVIVQGGAESAMFEMAPGDSMNSGKAFNKFLMNRGPYVFRGTDDDVIELYEYLTYKDASEMVIVSQDLGNIAGDIWLFENAVISREGVKMADESNIIWVKEQGYDGLRAAGLKKGTKEYMKTLKVPDDPFTIKEIVTGMLEFYPDWYVWTALGYAACCICRSELASAFNYFPLVLAFGQTARGKTRWVDVVRSLLGAGGIQPDTCKTTDKAYMRDMSKFHNLPMHLSEYSEKFEPILRDIFDLNLYKQAMRTQGKETYNPGVHAAAMFTSEVTPSSRSLLNRCLLMDFNQFHPSDAKSGSFKAWCTQMVSNNRGIGFLIEMINTDLKERILDNIYEIESMIVNENLGIESRTAEIYSCIIGGFVSVYDLVDGLEDVLKGVSKESMVKKVSESIKHSKEIVEGQDRLSAFMEYAHTLCITAPDRWKKVITVEAGELRMDLTAAYNEIIEKDNRGRHKLEGMQKEDVVARARSRFQAINGNKGVEYRNGRTLIIPIREVEDAFGLSFSDVTAEERGDPSVPF